MPMFNGIEVALLVILLVGLLVPFAFIVRGAMNDTPG